MFPTRLSCVYEVASDAFGVAGNVFAFTLFVSPIPTFRRIIRNRSTEQFSGVPYAYGLLNSLICLWYGLPFVSPGVLLVTTVNFIGALFHLVYISIFIIYADNVKKLKMSALLIAIFSLFVVMAFASVRLFDPDARQLFVGYLSVASLSLMFASPLFIIDLVIKTRSVKYMPFFLSLSTFLTSLSFFVYGGFKHEPFMYVPYGIGMVSGIVQLALYSFYSSMSGENSTEPLLERHCNP